MRELEELEDEWLQVASVAVDLAAKHRELLGKFRSRANPHDWSGWDSLLADAETVAKSAERLLAHDVVIARHYRITWARIAKALGQRLPTIERRYKEGVSAFDQSWIAAFRHGDRVRRGQLPD